MNGKTWLSRQREEIVLLYLCLVGSWLCIQFEVFVIPEYRIHLAR